MKITNNNPLDWSLNVCREKKMSKNLKRKTKSIEYFRRSTKTDSMPKAAVSVEKWWANQTISSVIMGMGSVNTSQIMIDSFWMFVMMSMTMAMVTLANDVDRMSLDDADQPMRW